MKVLLKRPELLVVASVVPVLLLLPGSTPLGIYALGVVTAAPLAMHAAGIILVFRSNRFIDFAQLQIGAVAATLFALLVNAQPVLRGVRAACPPCLESTSDGLLDASYWASLAISFGVAVFVGWLVYVAVIRKLDTAPRLVATVASLFLITLLAGIQRLLVTLLSTQEQRTFGGITNAVPPPGGVGFSIGTVRFGLPELLLVVVAVLGIAGIAVFLQRSAIGTAIRASSESASRAQTLGVDVVRVTGRVWMLVGALSGAAALLGAMSAPAGDGDSPAAGTSLVRILTVVVIARLVSLPMAGLAALALGVLTAAVDFSAGGTNLLDGSLVVVISGLLLLQRRSSTRTDVDTSSSYLAGRQARPVPQALRELPSVRSLGRGLSAALVLVLGVAPFLLSPSQTSVVSTTLLLAVVGMSLLVLTGWAGLVSLGQFGFAAVGAYVAAVSGLPFLLALPLGGLAGAVVAVLVGLPALRLQPLTLAVSTLAFAAAVPSVLLDPDTLGGALPETLERPLLLGLDLEDQRVFYYLVLLVLVAVSLGQFGFAAVGAYVAAVSGLPFLLALPLGGLAGAVVAVLVGLPALRLQPLTLAISTLAFAAAVPAVLLDPDTLGGALPETLERPLLLGLDLEDQRVFYYLVLLVLVATVLGVAGLRRSRTARALLAARDNEPAAQAFGISVLRARLQAFALSGFLAAFAGGLFAYQQAGVRADSFSVEQSLLVFTFTVIGGLGALGGPLLGFALLVLLNLVVTSPTIALLVNGLGGVVLLLLAPGGLAQVAVDARDGRLRRIAARNGIAVPGLGARDRLAGVGPSPITPKVRPGGGEVFVPQRYALDDQWALATTLRSAGEADRD